MKLSQMVLATFCLLFNVPTYALDPCFDDSCFSTSLPRGYINGSCVKHLDSDEIIVTPGVGVCRDAEWSTYENDTIDLSDTIPAGWDFVYIYIDYNSHTYGVPVFFGSLAEPEFDAAELGWYWGDNRCIGVVWVTNDTITAFAANPDGIVNYDGPTILDGANPTGTYQTIANSSNYSPVNSVALFLRAQTADTDNNCLILAMAEGGYDRIVEYGRKDWIAAWGWIHFNGIGGSRNVVWLAGNDDDNQVAVRIYGFEITR